MSGRPWTKREEATLRRMYGRYAPRVIGHKLGRTAKSVYQHADLHGLCRETPRVSSKDKETIICMAKHGFCNRCIGRATGHARSCIRRWRIKLGVPPLAARGPVTSCRSCMEKIRATTAEQCRRAGVKSLGEIRSLAFRRFAASHGWPEDLRPRAVQILGLLWQHGPMTRRQLTDAIGLPWRGSRTSLRSNDPEGSYLAHLIARGLVVLLGRLVKGVGRGRSVCLYSIAPGVEPAAERREIQ